MTTGYGAVGAAASARSYESAQPRLADRRAQDVRRTVRATRTTEDSATNPRRQRALASAAPASAGALGDDRKPQRPADVSRISSKPGERMILALDDDVLEQFAEAALRRRARGQPRPRGSPRRRPSGSRLPLACASTVAGGVAVPGAAGFQLLERLQPRAEPRELVLARTHRTRAPFVLDARARQLRLASRPGDPRASSASCARRRPSAADDRSRLELDRIRSARLRIRPAASTASRATRSRGRCGVLERVTQRRGAC